MYMTFRTKDTLMGKTTSSPVDHFQGNTKRRVARLRFEFPQLTRIVACCRGKTTSGREITDEVQAIKPLIIDIGLCYCPTTNYFEFLIG